MDGMANGSMVPLAGWTVPRPVFKRLEQVEAPTGSVVELANLKAHLRVTHSAEDSYLTSLIAVATEMVENYLSRKLLSRKMRMWMDMIPGTGNEFTLYGAGTAQMPIKYASVGMFRWFDLMGTPVTAFEAMKYITRTGDQFTFPADQYLVDKTDPDFPARIVLQYGTVWPVDLQVAHSLSVDYTLGYGAAADVPATLRHGVLLVAAALYSNRGDNADQPTDILDLPSIRSTLSQYRMLRISTL